MESALSYKEIEDFVRVLGRRANETLSYLGKNKQFINAISTPVGQELQRDIVLRLDELIGKIWEETASDQERAEFRALKGIQESWIKKINGYNGAIQGARESIRGEKPGSKTP